MGEKRAWRARQKRLRGPPAAGETESRPNSGVHLVRWAAGARAEGLDRRARYAAGVGLEVERFLGGVSEVLGEGEHLAARGVVGDAGFFAGLARGHGVFAEDGGEGVARGEGLAGVAQEQEDVGV